MSLVIDKFFYAALKADDDVLTHTNGRIYNTARTAEEEAADNVPYIIVTYDGMTNDTGTKDIDFEGDTDRETVSLLCVGNTREELASLTAAVRSAVYNHARSGAADAPIDYTLSAGSVDYDYQKPCVYQSLRYVCETNND